jgi:exosortase
MPRAAQPRNKKLVDNQILRSPDEAAHSDRTPRQSTNRSEFSVADCFSALLAVTSLLFWRGPLAATLSLARHDEQYTHILLIVPIAIALVVLDWKSQDSIFRPSLGMGSLMLLAVLADIAAPKISQLPDVQLSVRMLAFVLWSISAFTLCFGARAFRQASFPLLFLLWTVPFPDFVVNAIVSGLQQSSALAAHAIFVLARVPVEQRGLLIHIPDLTLEVAPECSSIRSSLVLVVTTMVLAHLLLRTCVEQTSADRLGHPCGHSQEWPKNLCPRIPRHPRRSHLSGRQTPPPGRIHLLSDSPRGSLLIALDFASWRNKGTRNRESDSRVDEDRSTATKEPDPELPCGTPVPSVFKFLSATGAAIQKPPPPQTLQYSPSKPPAPVCDVQSDERSS